MKTPLFLLRVSMMRELADASKISFRSVPEVAEKLSVLVARHRSRGVTLDGSRKLSREILANGLIIWLDSLPVPEQDRILSESIAALRLLLQDEIAAPPVPEAKPPRKSARGAS